MKNHLLLALIFLGAAFSSSAQMLDLSKSRIIVKGKEVTLAQLDSLSKQYPSFSIKTDFDTEPPTAYINFNTKEEVDSLQKLEENNGQKWLGQPMPSFSVRDLTNKLITSESLKGKIVVLNFYFTSCTPCIREMPELNELVKKFKDKNVEFIAFALNDETQLKKFLQKKPFHYTQVANAKVITEKSFDVKSWPTHFIFDTTGITHYQSQGFKETTISEIEAILNQLVQE